MALTGPTSLDVSLSYDVSAFSGCFVGIRIVHSNGGPNFTWTVDGSGTLSAAASIYSQTGKPANVSGVGSSGVLRVVAIRDGSDILTTAYINGTQRAQWRIAGEASTLAPPKVVLAVSANATYKILIDTLEVKP